MIVDMRADQPSGEASGHAEVADAVLHSLDAAPFGDNGDESGPGWIALSVALVLVIAWVGAAAWFAGPSLATADPLAAVQFAAALVAVPVLVGVVWLLVQRNSRAEAQRFGRTAYAMRLETAKLQRALVTITAALDDNRRELGAQFTQLSAIGDSAHQRLGVLGTAMAEQIGAADGHAHALAGAAAAAQTNLEVLLSSLPRATADAVATGQALESAGLRASEQTAALDAQVAALADRGREADQVAGGAAQRLAAHIARMEATSETAGARLEAVAADMSTSVDALLDRTALAIDQSRQGIASQGDAMLAMIDTHRATLDHAARESADALAQRIAAVETVIERIAARLDAQRSTGEMLFGDLDGAIGDAERRMDALHRIGVEQSQALAASISALGGSATGLSESLASGDALARRTIGTTEALLIALDAAAREIDETLPQALVRLDQRIGASRTVVGEAKPELLALVKAAESTHEAITDIAGVVGEQRAGLDQIATTLQTVLDTGRNDASEIDRTVDDAIGRANRFSEEAAPRLVEALLRVRDTATAAAEKARETLAAVIPEAAASIERAAGEAMRRATDAKVDEHVQALASASDAAVDAATRAAERLVAQLQAITSQTAVIDSRIQDARAEREESDSHAFSRRASLLAEALHSASIDITKSFAPDVADSAWAAYLKGDRGVFTRRAVRVLEPNDARTIARLYDDDATFREAVNRYIHDFENMLRIILAQGEGSLIGITLLSSDMGKLYVALAQGIERLR